MNGVPSTGWVVVASRVVVQVGFPIVVAGILLWYVLGDFQKNTRAMIDRMERNSQAVETFIEQLKEQTSELQAQTHELKTQTADMNEQTKTVSDIARMMEKRDLREGR